MLDAYDQVVIFFYFLSAVGSVVQGVTGFGDAIVLLIGWSMALSTTTSGSGGWANTILGANVVETLSLISSLRSVAGQPVLAYLARSGFSKELFLRLCPAQCIGVLIGATLLDVAPLHFIKIALGVTFILAAVAYILMKVREYHLKEKIRRLDRRISGGLDSDDSPTSQSPRSTTTTIVSPSIAALYLNEDGTLTSSVKNWAVAVAFLGGIGGGLVGVGGPPLMLFILWFQLPSTLVKGTLPASSWVSAVMRVVYALYLDKFDARLWLLYLHVTVGGLIGIVMGFRIGRHITELMYSVFVVCLLFQACLSILGVPWRGLLVVGLLQSALAYQIHRLEVRPPPATTAAQQPNSDPIPPNTLSEGHSPPSE